MTNILTQRRDEMIPQLLGGIAIATVGYGLAKWLLADNETLGQYKKLRTQIYETTIKEVQSIFKELKGFDKDLVINPEEYEKNYHNGFTIFDEISEATKEAIEKFSNMLTLTKSELEQKLNKIDDLITTVSDDYSRFNEGNQKLINDTAKIIIQLQNTINLPLSIDGKKISRKTQREFRKLDILLKD